MIHSKLSEIETQRLWLRPVSVADSPQVQRIFPQWEVVKHLNARVPWPYPEDGVLRYYEDELLPAVGRGDEWHWNIRLKNAPDQIIGGIGLMRGERNNRGFWIEPQWQEQGFMTEAVVATNDYWFDVLRFAVLRVPKAAANVASRRLSEKTGMRLIALEEHDFVSGRATAEIWEMTADEWRIARTNCV